MNKCTVFTGGEMKDLSFVDIESVKKTFVICADSGYLYAEKLGVKPDVVIGDYDSLGFAPDLKNDVFTFPIEKDDTDLMLAIKHALKLGYKDIDIYGALGGRFDHTFGNIQALGYISSMNANARILSENEEISLLNPGKYVVSERDGYSLSLFAYSDVVKNYCINGVKYPADTTLTNCFPLGISNKILEEKAEISFTEGRLLMVQSKIINQNSNNA